MAFAYWCILIAALLPYLWVSIAKGSGERYNNRDPRGWQTKQTDLRSHRAHAAHLNGFESFPAFVAGVLMAQLAGVDPGTISTLAIVFVIARVLHGVLYIANRHTLRSLVWVVGFGSAIALIVMAALKVG
ncbi:MAG TPA: MAPEG family protein [Pseudoxanthomonas sp.]